MCLLASGGSIGLIVVLRSVFAVGIAEERLDVAVRGRVVGLLLAMMMLNITFTRWRLVIAY